MLNLNMAWLCFQQLAQRYPLQHLAGHEHIAPGRKHDPGPGFAWATLRALLPPVLQQHLRLPPSI